MAGERGKKKTNILVWIVLGLLILALGGFGATGFGRSVSTVATVGDREITAQQYFDALRNEQARLQEQTGQTIPMQQMALFGIDRQVMERLLAGTALAAEADRIGLSAGDAQVARRIRETPAFGGIDGTFDRDYYARALQNAGLDEARYEQTVREDVAREILQAAVVGGVAVPDAYADRMAAWIAETRDVTLATVTVPDLPGGPTAPSEIDLTAFYDANPELFETPERRTITYAWVTPDMIAAGIEVDEGALRDLYEERATEFRQPARVLAERLAFADMEAAEAARAAIEAGETTFDALVTDRGLTLDDVDQGEVARSDVDDAVADALFALDQPGIAGPVETPLGPALYRVNAILDPTEVPFDDVRDDLAIEFSADAARRRIDAGRDGIDDLLAGGATLEELAGETDMEVATFDWDPTGTAEAVGIAAYQEFREIARAAEEGDFPELASLSDGGLFAVRLDGVTPPTVPPFEEVRGAVETAWQTDTLRRRLTERAEELARDPSADIAVTPEVLTGIARDAVLENTPPALIDRIFEAEPGEVLAVEGDDTRAYVVRLDAINAADLTAGDGARLRDAVVERTRGELVGDLFESYGQAIQGDLGFTVDSQAVQGVQAQLGGAG
ncbi:peptidyl-prolyl cis-trans isomerase [Jannaschia rubra]|uniref:peptidyl-prolyl cis-trans isomerase n=1 Tax=Jannaschia rubra TaxID=282197 RepID=UPI00248F948D|nr:peptidyl-prolyl cis-trans isomerase [Jannaschia rubra]